LDELLQSGVLEDVGADHGDDIAKQLNELGSTSQVENELAALKSKAALSSLPAPAALGPGTTPAGGGAGSSEPSR
jgi:phage shock protein A